MKIKTLLYTLPLVLSFPLFVNALDTSKTVSTNLNINLESYASCKQSALTRREQTMAPALKEYVISSENISNKAISDLDKIKWYINSYYNTEAKKIKDNQAKDMIPVNEKIARVRAVAQNTWKAEDSLCDVYYNKASSTPVKINKKK